MTTPKRASAPATEAAPLLASDLLDFDLMTAHIQAGYVKIRQHPTLPLSIYNYAEKTAYERAWDAVTSQCRGLIVHCATGHVVARPWPKFFNLGEHPEDTFDLDAPVEVTDKQDGSLGILVQDDDRHLIATRGSFTSDQALHATDLYHDRYRYQWNPKVWLTYLFEIVYPANRIVLDYGDLDDLVLLGAVEIATGRTLGPNDPALSDWPGPRTATFAYSTLREALTAEPRPNAEGVVVRFTESDALIKIKQQDYMELHRIVTGLNARVVWERCQVEGGFTDLIDALPDEFQGWAITVAHDLNAQAAEIERQALDDYERIQRDLHGTEWSRKDFALAAVQSPHKALLFQLLDGKPIRDHVWKALRPSGEIVPRYFGEDTA